MGAWSLAASELLWNGFLIGVCAFFSMVAWAFFQQAKARHGGDPPAASRLMGCGFTVIAAVCWMGTLDGMGALPPRVHGAWHVLIAPSHPTAPDDGTDDGYRVIMDIPGGREG